MRRGKFIFGFVFGIVALSLLSSFVSAYYYYGGFIGNGIDAVVNAWEPIFAALLGGFGWSGMYLFERLLLFILLMAVVYVAVGRVSLLEGNKNVRWIVSIIVPLLGIRYINYEWLSALILQYQMLAIVLTAVLPFILYFYFVHNISNDSGTLRKAMWILYAFVYTGLWSTAGDNSNSYIYLWSVIAAIVMIFMDHKIALMLESAEMRRQGRQHLELQVAELRKQIDQINSYVKDGQLDPRVGRKEVDKLMKQVNWLIKHG